MGFVFLVAVIVVFILLRAGKISHIEVLQKILENRQALLARFGNRARARTLPASRFACRGGISRLLDILFWDNTRRVHHFFCDQNRDMGANSQGEGIGRPRALVSYSSEVVPDLSRAVRANTVLIPVVDALALAGRSIGVEQSAASDFNATGEPLGLARKQTFEGDAVIGVAEASLVWLPMNRNTLRMCWRVVIAGRTSGELFQTLIDASSGELLVRQSWSKNAVEAAYLVFDEDSAAPLLPGRSSPITNQAAVTTQVNLTLTALSATASPSGWVNTNASLFALTNTTFGNNVDAHLDWTEAAPTYGSTNILLPRPLAVLTNGHVEFTGSSFTVDFPAVSEFVTSKSVSITLQGEGAGPGEGSP